ncbi:hypothetical protein FNF28_02833 [Cafeteria roenbergensis]|uniref:Nucleoporin Nup54 alpha-helical domain-containing protein n=1 Tax=Cafeteria roenbergensis TaxID=33653 RepID=A0A5A8DU21_CAFRO|nr:hypothetical protein FNF28_02833 [Cafeteria roenbergensis]
MQTAANPFAAPAATAANPFAAPAATAAFGAPAATAANPFAAPAATAANPFGAPAATAANPFGAPAATAANPFGAPAATAANPFGAPAATAAPAAPAAGIPGASTSRRAADVEREYAQLRVAYSNLPIREGQVTAAPAPVYGVPQPPQVQGSDRILHAPFVRKIFVPARQDRDYQPPLLCQLDCQGNLVKTSQGQPQLVPLLSQSEMRAVRRRLGRRVKHEDEDEEEDGATGQLSVPTVIIGFQGLTKFSKQLQSRAESITSKAEKLQAHVGSIVEDLQSMSTEMDRLEESQRRCSRRCLQASHHVAEQILGSRFSAIQDEERLLMRRINAIHSATYAPHGLRRRTEAVLTQAALSGAFSDSQDGSGSADGTIGPKALESIAKVLVEQQGSIDELKRFVREAAEDLRVVERELLH